MTEHSHSRYRYLLQLTLIAETVFWTLAGLAYVFFRPGALAFLHPGAFWLFLLIPVIFVVFLQRWQWKNRLYNQYRSIGKTRMIWVTRLSRSIMSRGPVAWTRTLIREMLLPM